MFSRCLYDYCTTWGIWAMFNSQICKHLQTGYIMLQHPISVTNFVDLVGNASSNSCSFSIMHPFLWGHVCNERIFRNSSKFEGGPANSIKFCIYNTGKGSVSKNSGSFWSLSPSGKIGISSNVHQIPGEISTYRDLTINHENQKAEDGNMWDVHRTECATDRVCQPSLKSCYRIWQLYRDMD